MKAVITLLLISLFATITLASSLAEENPFVWILSDSAKARKFIYSDDPWWTPVLQAIAAEEQKKAVSAPIKSTPAPQQPVEEKHLTELGNIIAQQLKNKQQNTATTQEDDDWDEFLTVIKAGVKEYVNKHWDAMPESDKGIWKSIWNVVKGVGKGAVKNYVNTHWDEENDKSPKLVLNKRNNNSTRVVRPKKRQNRKVNLEKLIRKFLKNRKTTRKPRRMINRKSRNAERRRNLRKLIKKLLLKKEKRNTRKSFRRNGGIDKAMKRLRSSFKQLKNKKNRKTTKKSLGDHHFDNNVIPNPWFPVVKFLFKDGQ